MTYYAHSGTAGEKSDWQTLPVHLLQTASLAAAFAAPLGLERLAFMTGLFHDLGKYDPQSQRRLEGIPFTRARSAPQNHQTRKSDPTDRSLRLAVIRPGGEAVPAFCSMRQCASSEPTP